MEKLRYAPIVIFAFNRPAHLMKSLQALSRNRLANQSKLYFFIDGSAEEDANYPQNLEVIKVAQDFHWQGLDKEICVRPKNFGLAGNIINGVSSIIEKHGRVIVLEDDLETSPGFLEYMNHTLDFYQNIKEVMHIAGYTFPVSFSCDESTFFYQVTSCWGWATWNDRWIKMNLDAEDLLEKLTRRNLINWFDLDGSGIFLSQLNQNISGVLTTWAIKWQASVNLSNGFSLHPRQSLVRNIGFDGSGVHCVENDMYLDQQLIDTVPVTPIKLIENKSYRNAMKKFYKRDKETGFDIFTKIKHKIYTTVGYDPVYNPKWHKIEQGVAKDLKLFITAGAFEGWRKMISGDFDSFWYEELYKLRLEPKVVLDIGAHFGYHTLALSRLFAEAQLIAFEPNPTNIKRLRKHLRKNSLIHRVRVMDLALSNYTGNAIFRMSSNIESSQSTGSYLKDVVPPLNEDVYRNFNEIEVKVDTLDNYCSIQKVVPDLIKIDVEGAELDLLEGARNIIAQSKPVLCIEAHSSVIRESIFDKFQGTYQIKVLDEDEMRSFLMLIPLNET